MTVRITRGEMFEINRHPGLHELRSFGRAMLIGFGVVGLVIWLLAWRKGMMPGVFSWSGAGAQIAAVVFWMIGAGLFGLTRSASGPARRVYVVWMTGANAIGIVMSTMLLTLLYIVVLPGFSLIVQMGDPLRKRFRQDGTYWEPYKPHEPTLERMGRPF